MDKRRVLMDVQAPVRARIEGLPAPLKLEIRHAADGAMVVSRLAFLRKGAQITLDDPNAGPDATARVATIHDVQIGYPDGGAVPELTIALGPVGIPREAVREETLHVPRRLQLEALAPLLGGSTLAILMLLALNW
jgi:hypothetical protein